MINTTSHHPPYFNSREHKTQQNKQSLANVKKVPSSYEDQNESYLQKPHDSFEVKDLKYKMKIMMQKLANNRKEKDQLQKQNQSLQKEIITLRNNVRHMIPGFSNTSTSFPMCNQLIAKLHEFYKYECLDRFFDTLCPEELSMKGFIYFYYESFRAIESVLKVYFAGTFEKIKESGCLDELEGPIMNVLRKSYQTTYEKIFEKIKSEGQIFKISQRLINKLSLCSEEQAQLEATIGQFLEQLLELSLMCRISDPPLNIQIDSIGKKINYNSIYNDPLDGFIKNKESCWVVLPEIRKSENQQVVVKSLVLKTDYFDEDEEENRDQEE